MTQHQFLDRRFQQYNVALIKVLQNLAIVLEAQKCWEQSQVIRKTLLLLLVVEARKALSVAAIEEDIEQSLLLE